MKKLTAVAVALLAATSGAQAAEVYKNEQMALDMYGRIYAGQFFGEKKDGTNDYSDKLGANQFIRFGVNVRFFNIEGTEDMLIDTVGMSTLFLPDLQ